MQSDSIRFLMFLLIFMDVPGRFSYAPYLILTEENLVELVRLANEEITQAKDQYKEELKIIDGQLEDLRERLDKLYNALETGHLDKEAHRYLKCVIPNYAAMIMKN